MSSDDPYTRVPFQSTPSAREGDVAVPLPPVPVGVSIHAFREGRRLPSSTSLMRGSGVSIHAFREGRRPSLLDIVADVWVFQSTPSAREGDRRARVTDARSADVSIHAFREGRRPRPSGAEPVAPAVSIHAFREGRRPALLRCPHRAMLFQSTPSAREGDMPGHWPDCWQGRRFQSTPSAREGDRRGV